MEGGCVKTEPADDSDNELKTGIDINVNAESLTIINRNTSNNSCNESKNALEENGQIPRVEDGANKIRDTKTKRGRKAATDREKKSYVCDECGKEFKRAYGLSRHKLLHSGIKPYVCSVENCGAAFSQSSTLKSHQMSHTGERKFFCEECGQGFQSKFHLQAHQRSRHNGERPYVCVECGEAFTRRQGLTRHQLEHHLSEKPFECADCGMKFFESRLLKSHQKTHTTDGTPFQCTECGKEFYHKTSLNAHQRNHSTVRQFGCETCGKRFTQKGTLNIHKLIHSDVRPFNCPECGLGFTQKFTLKTHRIKQHGLSTDSPKLQKAAQHTRLPVVTGAEPKILSHSDNTLASGYDNIRRPETSEISAICSIVSTGRSIFPLSAANSNGLKDATESGSEAQQPDKIGKRFILSVSESNYSEDMVETNDEESSASSDLDDKSAIDRSMDMQPHSIDGFSTSFQIKEESTVICEPSFDIWKTEPATSDDDYVSESEKSIKKEVDIKNSRNDESVERPLSCGKCERKFALVSALKNHQRSHRQTKKEKSSFICDECGKILSGKQSLRIHKRIHSGSTAYPCQECGKNFTSLGNMKIHQRTHSGERPFACETCGLTFVRKSSLDKHKQTHTNEKPFECDICGLKFRSACNLKRHILSHTGQKNYSCDICNKTFADKNYIKFHIRTHTGYKPCACDQCPSKFINKSQLKCHKRHSHREIGEPSPYRQKKMKKMLLLNAMQ